MHNPIAIDPSLKNKVVGSMELVIREVFNNYFGVSVNADNEKITNESGKYCLCEVRMQQEGMDMFMCFHFDADLLYKLVDETYSGEAIHDLTPYNDAACEIANIVCCRIKAVLNGNGYKFNMDIPQPIENSDKFKNLPDEINMHFSTSNGNGFFINLFSLEKKNK